MSALKISISIDSDKLKKLRQRARRKGGNLSAVFAEATELLLQREAQERLLKKLGGDISEEEAAEVRAEWSRSLSTPAR